MTQSEPYDLAILNKIQDNHLMGDNILKIPQIYKLRVTLRGIVPAIFRTVVVSGETTLREFHELLQGAFGWGNCHLHAFRDQRGMTYTSPQEGLYVMDMEMDDVDDGTIRLDSVLKTKGDRLMYEYDFGDGWEHEVRVQGIGAPSPKGLYPAVIDGARACPPEDCGGPPGYQRLMELAGRKRAGVSLEKEEEEQLGWLGKNYDPAEFDVDEANTRVASIGKHS